MEAKEMVEYFRHNPPTPFCFGCAKLALSPFLRCMQLVGAYHENGQYGQIVKELKKAFPPCLYAVYNNKENLATTQRTPPLFSTKASQGETKESMRNDYIYSINPNQPSLNPGDSQSKEKNTFLSIQEFPDCSDPQKTYDMPSCCAEFDNPMSTQTSPGVDSSQSFLMRCRIVENRLTHEKIVAMGYDLPPSVAATKEQEEADKCQFPSAQYSLVKSLWSDRTYAFILLLVHWFNFLRCGACYYRNHERISPFTALIPSFFYLMVASCNTNMFISCTRPTHFYMFFVKWSTIFRDTTTRALGMRGTLNTKYMRVAVTIQWSLTLANVACCAFLMLKEDSFSAGMNYMFYLDGKRSTLSVVISSVLLFFTSATWIGAIIFTVVLSHHVSSHFREFGQVLRLHIAAAQMEFPPTLTLLRERYIAMCDNVTVLDRYLRVSVGIYFSIFISLACLNLYQMVRIPMDGSVMGVTTFWLSSCLIMVAVPAYSMANVNVAIHSVTEDLYSIQTRNMTLDQFGQLQLFLDQANGPNMGFTVLGLIVVNHELMLTLFGVYLSYGIVLLQF